MDASYLCHFCGSYWQGGIWWYWNEYFKSGSNSKSVCFLPTQYLCRVIVVHKAMVDGHSGSTILGELAASSTWQSLNWSSMDMMIGSIPGSVGETSFIAIALGAIILIATGIGSWRIILSTFLGGFVMASLFNLWGANELMTTPAEIHLIIGSFAFGAVFMATDPVTGSQTNKGKYIYGFLIGVFAILIRVFNPAYPEGMMLAILLMNIFAPLIDHYVLQANINKRLKRVKAIQ